MKYSIEELDRMRRAISDLMTNWEPHGNGIAGIGPKESAVEERLRTYMLNGTTAEELEEAARAHRDPVMRRQRELTEIDRQNTLARAKRPFNWAL